MNRFIRRVEDAPPLERDMNPEIIRSERTRVLVMLGIYAVLFLVSVAFSGAIALGFRPHGEGWVFPPTTLLAGFCLLVLAYELVILKLLDVVQRRGVMLPDPPRYGNTLFEVSCVSVVLAIFAQTYDPALALNSPALLFYGVLIILSTLRLSFPLSLFTAALAAAEYAGLSLHFLAGRNVDAAADYWLPFSMGKAVVLLASGVIAGIVAVELRKRIDATIALLDERARIVSTFGQYISPAVVDRLLRSDVSAATELRAVTVMFLDIRSFTRFSEKKSPDEVVAYLNRLFGFMVECVNRNSGVINKFLGDGFMAIFGAPFSEGRDNINAANAAREILTELTAQNSRGDIPATRVGIGIHSGLAVVGTIGSAERKEYTVIGDAVNLASRVEGLNKEFNSSLLVTEQVYRDVRAHHPGEALPPVKVKGRDEDVQLFKLM
ncbi:MAG: adenylate/guanylate cyclase domain-containing protein [Deltaproteobacteria bacterium]|nr:adenylate/guanylate cyclase domain-containing protein [Deltaproteobacteria bacterium]